MDGVRVFRLIRSNLVLVLIQDNGHSGRARWSFPSSMDERIRHQFKKRNGNPPGSPGRIQKSQRVDMRNLRCGPPNRPSHPFTNRRSPEAARVPSPQPSGIEPGFTSPLLFSIPPRINDSFENAEIPQVAPLHGSIRTAPPARPRVRSSFFSFCPKRRRRRPRSMSVSVLRASPARRDSPERVELKCLIGKPNFPVRAQQWLLV
ncbi:hypothetical protein ACJRO7_012576 [Eucalyptus globulus]|uniref:Uncharacterized protein n=1 Tax=Eucalyptus globulus TaxID=34317 RepID=A0ABD3LJ23_EUCGL